jgi:tripartite-type tricarboxylate transporter receptor subunit TctC
LQSKVVHSDIAVKVIVPLPPGSEPVAVLRVITDKLQERWGQPVVVEPRPGASQNLSADAVARAEARWLHATIHAAGAAGEQRVDVQEPVLRSRLTISPKVPASTFAEPIAYAKAYPGKLTYASPGVGTIPYLSMKTLLRRAGISMVHVPFTALPQGQLDLIAGRIDVILDPAPARAIEFH